MAKKNKRIVKYQRPFNINVGILIFLLIFIYLVFISYRYFAKEHVTIYEVTEKRIADDNRVTGLVIRDEVVVNASKSGYINYYTNEGKKIAKNTIVYTIDKSGKISDYLSDLNVSKQGKVDSDSIRKDILQYKRSFDFTHYNRVYDLKYDLENTILESTSETVLTDLQEALSQRGEEVNYEVVKTEQSGIISYNLDGMEGLRVEDVTMDMFENPEVERVTLRSLTSVEADSPVYKLISNETWYIMVPLNFEQLEKLKDKTDVNINICKDNLSINVGLTTLEIDGKPFAKLDMKKYMIRYLTDRFLEIELIINSAEGLKIPNSSILEKECYIVPKQFLIAGGDSTDEGIVKEVSNEEGELAYEFVEINTIMEDEEHLYIDSLSLNKGDWIRNSSQDRIQLLETVKMEGVYNVNEGYCKFRRIEKEYKNQEYCIVKKGTKYGLSLYDHILVNPEYLKEEDLIY